ncbi:phosphotransferase enzyme family protein [Nonomuraea sp. NPDC050663]|uniref:phosphotransferase enzyme family protein n=1 Tax=Nonomuraea sp. NPDC050663 TaxID=3364370 RepID=UPI00379EFE5E
MMPLTEIHAMSTTVDGDGSSPVADTLAAPWQVAPRRALFRRSSATHVFAVRDPAFPYGARYLRAVPAAHRDPARVAGSARLVADLARLGAGVAAAVPSAHGRLVETVSTELGDYHVMLVEGAAGSPIRIADLTPARARRWGAALAGLHGLKVEPLPPATIDLRRAESAFPDDPPLVAAILSLADRVDALPRDDAVFGLTHNDFELDNLAWDGDTVTAFDFDDAGASWFAADISKAVDELPGREGSPLFDAFVSGYRSVRGLDDDGLAWVPLFDLARAADTVIVLRHVLDVVPGSGHPQWLHGLHGALQRLMAQERDRLLGLA